MSETHEYNGWSNYETWAVALWLDNDEVSYNEAREGVRVEDPDGETKWRAADWLKTYVEAEMPDLGGTLWGDLLGAAFSEVDWYEVAAHYMEEE